MDIEAEIEGELRYFESDEQRQIFKSTRISPTASVQSWAWGDERHTCTIVARDNKNQIVYCETGFGPEAPWSVQAPGEVELGMDSEWYSYLYEAFVVSTMWSAGTPKGFMHMARGER